MRAFSFVCFTCRRSAKSPTQAPLCPVCGQRMVLLDAAEQVPRKTKAKAWDALEAQVGDRIRHWVGQRHRSQVYERPKEPQLPPETRNRPGKKRGQWMTLVEVWDLFVEHEVQLAPNFQVHFTATTMRTLKDGSEVYFRPAVMKLLKETKIAAVVRALGG